MRFFGRFYTTLFGAWLLLLPLTLQAQPLYAEFDRTFFEANVRNAMDRVRDILSEERMVELAEHQEHTYQDKFALVELVTRATSSLILGAFNSLGMDLSDAASKVFNGDTVMIKLETNGSCEFLQENETKIKGSGTEILDALGNVVRDKRDVHYTKEYHWNVTVSYDLYTCDDSCENKRQTLRSRTASTVLVTGTKKAPRVEKMGRVARLNLTRWLRQAMADQPFLIDREKEGCKTPRRNPDVARILELNGKIFDWCRHAGMQLFLYSSGNRIDTRGLTVVALPWLENSTIVNEDLISQLLVEQKRVFDESLIQLNSNLKASAPDILISTDEGFLDATLNYVSRLIEAHSQSVAYIEDLLKRQLIQAIGKEIHASDFAEYMRFHSRKLFTERFAPKPFSRAVGRPNQYPVGLISVEETDSPSTDPIYTFTRRIAGKELRAFRIPISAATHVQIAGERYLTGWARYDFSSQASSSFALTARARQFSSFLLVIGTITGPETLDPKHAIILKNKDEVKIFLDIEVLPSAKEFKDAIKSLSPEQQAFARAFRAMQLESSVFGLCVIQLKPQLENLLNLPDGALSKEIELSEELTSLFVDFQIPSDLLSYDGPPDAPTGSKVDIVKAHARSVVRIIDENKKKQAEEEKMRAATRQAMFTNGWSSDNPSFAPSSAPSSLPSFAEGQVGSTQTLRRASRVTAQPTTSERYAKLESIVEAEEKSEYAPPSATFQHQDEQQQDSSSHQGFPDDHTTAEDFTAIPRILDEKLGKYDTDGALKSMIIKSREPWIRNRQANLLVAPTDEFLSTSEIESETKKAFDLLDAISRSGTLPIESSEVHVIIGVAHCFDKSLVETVIEDNINPITKAEQSLLLLASTIYNNESIAELVAVDK
mmetsp:Transcript_4975/g.10192  ORF Transcript_4975/g.10192 Transcript_4975/m.10192 type:complete len:885 (-) Transcript_4975:39-2693(-)